MRLFHKLAGFSFLISFILISKCRAVDLRPTEMPTLAPIAVPLQTLAPTWAKESTATSSLTVLPSHTATPTETATATLPVISKEEVEINTKHLLLGDSGSLPNWWALIPGTTTWEEAKYFIMSKGIIPSYYYRLAPWDIYWYGNHLENLLVSVELEFYVRQKVVNGIKISAGATFYKEGLSEFRGVMRSYAPEVILEKYGKPSEVWVLFYGTSGEHGNGSSSGTDLWLFYEQGGFLVQYHGVTDQMDNKYFYFCPIFIEDQIQEITIFLSHLESGVPITSWANKPEYYEPLAIELAAGLTVEEFYNLYQQDDQVVCIKSPRELWK